MLINNVTINSKSPTYFIADIAANHDLDLNRAKELIEQCAISGADAAKFQHFRAPYIVSDKGFKDLGEQVSHQADWKQSVYQVYDNASLPWEWTDELSDHAQKCGIEFFTSPYDFDAVDYVNRFVNAFKIGSGDITWLEIIKHIASKGKPTILATGASNLDEVQAAVSVLDNANIDYCIMQCNTNYTASMDNFKYLNLNVLKTYSELFPKSILGLSDHTPGHASVLGAVALGARIIEKHFTDDTKRTGPDHHFSMTPRTWKEMVERTRELECSMGTTQKKVENNELETVILQRRSLRYAHDLPKDHITNSDDFVVLRPAPKDSLKPSEVNQLIGKKLSKSVLFHDTVKHKDFQDI